MTLNETLLQALAGWRPEGKDRHVLNVPDEGSGWTVSVSADRNDELGCLVWEAKLRRSKAPADNDPTLRAWAEQCVPRVTGLMEPLALLEVDEARGEALLRSDPPTQRGETVLYYEVLLQGTKEAVLRRYQGAHEPHRPRFQVVSPLTHEALAKAVAGLAWEG